MSLSNRAKNFIKDEATASRYNTTLWWMRQRRDGPVKTIPEWEYLRDAASRVKDHVLSHLDEYLLEFEKRASGNGIKVLWAKNAEEHNEHVHTIIQKHGAKHIVKTKSVLAEECHLNEYLESKGYDVINTDLGERIIQVDKQVPGRIVLPVAHLTSEKLGGLFQKHLEPAHGVDNPQRLAETMRNHLREKFLTAEVAITGVNFAIAETGGIVLCTNEGNTELSVHLAKVHIAAMGIEEIIPKAEHLGIFTRLFARSATGQHITANTSHFVKPRAGCSMYIIIVDNGRASQLGKNDFRSTLKCIQCGACMNTCPVYRETGGYSYNSIIPGPIGSVVGPHKNIKKHSSMPFASTLCGSCTDVCPVKIDIHQQLFKWRETITKRPTAFWPKRIKWRTAGYIFSKPLLFRIAGKFIRWWLRSMPRGFSYNVFNRWGKSRELPVVPDESFREWYLQHYDRDTYGL